ncbi:hypothetical protein WJX73_006765 [Symbiochloris irregularis]|uniref:Uncharacterized protein n=1 Tax=Symbiochloris irregularis TaxID=706552 RepID=A0AAW1NZN1_9CHLO
MVRNCVLDQVATDRIVQGPGQQLQVGLLLGSFDTGARDFIARVQQTPPTEEGQDPFSWTAGGKSSILLDESWISDHSGQVTALCTGGLAVVGLYLVCPQAAFTKASTHICKLAAVIRASQGVKRPAAAAPVLDSLVSLKCSFTIHLAVPVTRQSQTAKIAFQEAVEAECRSIASATAIVNGRLASSEQVIHDLLPSEDLHDLEVELLTQPRCLHQQSGHELGVSECTAWGRVQTSGTITGRAVAHRRDTLKSAVQSLKEDLAASLRQRMQLLVVDAEEDASEASALSRILCGSDGPTAEPMQLHLPKRVMIPLEGCMELGDHLLPGDDEQQAVTTACEVLSLDVTQPNQLHWPEEFGASAGLTHDNFDGIMHDMQKGANSRLPRGCV